MAPEYYLSLDEEGEREYPYFTNDYRHQVKLSLPPDVHLPNKNEAKELRKIMSQTGLSEKEVRSIHKYRKQLSEASKNQGGKNNLDRECLKILKSITKSLKLPKNHPRVIEEFKKNLNKVKVMSESHFTPGYRFRKVYWITEKEILERLKLI